MSRFAVCEEGHLTQHRNDPAPLEFAGTLGGKGGGMVG